jgi:hypothetical protein
MSGYICIVVLLFTHSFDVNFYIYPDAAFTHFTGVANVLAYVVHFLNVLSVSAYDGPEG